MTPEQIDDLETAVRDLSAFVDTLGPEHPARIEWTRAKSWILHALGNQTVEGP